MARYSPTRTYITPGPKSPSLSPSRVALTPYDHDDDGALALAPSLGEVMIRDEIFEEAKLRDILVQRRISREGIRWEALPYSVQREVDAIRDLYASAASSGHPTAAYNLGLMYYLGKGVAKDLRRAVGLLQQAAGKGHMEASFLMTHSEAQYNLALLYLSGGHGVVRDPPRGVVLLGRAADQGHIEATYRLGRMLFVGDEVPRDHRRALVLLQRAADGGKAEASILIKSSKSQYTLGRMHEEGDGAHGVPQSYARAVQCYRRSASEGHAEAQHRLGLLYQQGLGTPENSSLAVTAFQRSAHQGLAESQHHLGVLYYHGQGVPRDWVRARGFWRRAAEQGHPEAQFSLGYLYFNAEGVARNLPRAAELYGQAAAQGHGKAATTLAYMRYHGDGVERDFWLAAELARKGAAAEQPDAHFLLGVMHENGDGVVRDPVAALQCYRRASRLGHAEAEGRLASVAASLRGARGPMVGETVVVHGMPLSTGFNGKAVLVLGYDAVTGYCNIELPDGRTTKFRPDNLAAPY